MSTVAAALCGTMVVSALDATNVKVSLPSISSLKAQPIEGGYDTVSLLGKGDKAKTTSVHWSVINIPVEVKAKAKTSDPDFVPAITFKAHVLLESDTAKSGKVLVSKELTYNDIPVGKVQGGVGTDMHVSLLVSPRNAVKLDKSGKPAKVLAVAMEASFEGRDVMTKSDKTPNNYVLDKTLDANGKWWETKKITNGGVELFAVNETPYGPFMHPTAPRVTTKTGGSSASATTSSPVATADETSDTATDTPTTETTDTPTTTDSTATDTTTTDETAVEDSKSSKSRKSSSKNRRSSRRR